MDKENPNELKIINKNERIKWLNIVKEKKQKIADLEAKLTESEKRLKDIDNWKENYGYSNYEDTYMLEDLQSRAFQSEDDTKVVYDLLDYLNISDETEILSTLKQKLEDSEEVNKKLAEHSQSVDKALDDSCDVIRNLKQKLTECEKCNNEWTEIVDGKLETINRLIEEKHELQQQLEDKDKLLKQKISKMKSTDFIRMCKECGFMVQAKEIDNQTAIAVLEEMLDNEVYINSKLDFEDGNYVLSKIIRTKIKSLKGE